MTQKQRVLAVLTQAEHGLTATELRDLTDLPEGSLRTILWELRKNGLTEVAGGVRGRYRYGITERGREEAAEAVPAQPRMPAEALSQASMLDTMALSEARHERRTLRAYARMLAQEHADLFAGDSSSIAERLEAAIDEFLAPDYHMLEKVLIARMRRARGETPDEP